MSEATDTKPARVPRPRKPKAAYWVPDHHKRWRPRLTAGPVCGYEFRGKVCERKGAHYCEPRADRAVRFPAELLRHIKGPFRRKPFVLRPWQEHEIFRPLFGEVVWSAEWQRYVRRYRRAYIIMARKNGKSEIAAAIQLLLMVGDDEESAEVYSAAKDTKQAEKVFGPALRMVMGSPVLARRLKYYKNEKRLVDERSGSTYEIITADAKGELGHNPHAFNLDEVLSQPDGSLWEAMDTADGAREQELMFATSTETDEEVSFGAKMIDEAERIMHDPKLSPHSFAYVRKVPSSQEELRRIRRTFKGHPDLPVSTDPFDEANWKWANPALDQFKSREAMRRHVLKAKRDAQALKAFRQFQLNQRVQALFSYFPLDLWDLNVGEPAATLAELEERLARKRCWAGLDLSSKLDLSAWCLQFEAGEILWRFWVPESVVDELTALTDGAFQEWIGAGWVTVTEGNVIDYEAIYAQIEADRDRFVLVDGAYDKWSGEPVRQEILRRTGLELYESNTTYERMTGPMTEAKRGVTAGAYDHFGNPVARWMAEHMKARNPAGDVVRVRPVKPERRPDAVRIDGMPAWFMALDSSMRISDNESVYERRGLLAVGGTDDD